MAKNLAQQFEKIVKSKYIYNVIGYSVVEKARILLLDAQANRRWFDVTGNLWKSIGVAVFRQGKTFWSSTTPGPQPTMRSLVKGQVYPLPFYYGGNKVGEKPYVGETQSRHYTAKASLEKELKPGQFAGYYYAIRLIAAMPYAKYVESKENKNVLDNTIRMAKTIISEIKLNGL